jgi:hypothetical protein
MDVVLCCPGRKKEKREGGRGWPRKVPRSLAAHKEKKKEKNKPTAKVPDRPNGERGKAITKKKYFSSSITMDLFPTRIFFRCLPHFSGM